VFLIEEKSQMSNYTMAPSSEEEGQAILGGERKKSSSMHPALIALIVVACVILIAGAAVGIFFAFEKDTPEPTTDYGIIIDAGSSGSRIYVYDWPHRKNKTTVPVVSPLLPPSEEHFRLRQLTSDRDDLVNNVKPGIAKIPPENISTYLQPLLDYANSLIPDDQKPRTPIFLFATAGMRLLPAKDQDAIIAAVRTTLGDTKFNFTYKDDWARVITGSEEGVFGWVTSNYLKGILFEDDAKDHVVGALDLGGASLQITFLPDEKPKENGQILTLPNNVFDLYTYSFLKYGQDKSMEGVIQLFIDDVNVSGVVPEAIPFPCYLNGYNETFVIDGVNHTLVGTGDFETCASYERKFMNLNATCAVEPCSIDGIYQPEVKGEFYAMSGFFYTADFFGFANETEKVPPSKFKEFGTDWCLKSWESAVAEHPNLSVDLLKVYCFTSSYIYTLLTSGFHFGENDASIYFTAAINGTTLNWALGGLIAEASLLPK